jgi:hypothetical protein
VLTLARMLALALQQVHGYLGLRHRRWRPTREMAREIRRYAR